jgi:type IV secretory pathway TrbD component
MKKNVGNGDRFLRIIIGIIAIILGLSGSFEGIIKWIALGFGLIMIVTSSLQFCGLYALFGINTCKVKKK